MNDAPRVKAKTRRMLTCPNCLATKHCDKFQSLLAEYLVPHGALSLKCLSCGFTVIMGFNAGIYLSLDALNDLRHKNDLELLAALPKQDVRFAEIPISEEAPL